MRNRGWTLVGLALLGCGAEGADVTVRFQGRAPLGAFLKDARSVEELCPDCRQPVGRADPSCGNLKDGRPCGRRLRHPQDAPCGSCNGSKACAACSAFGTAGTCRHCGGTARRGELPCFACSTGHCSLCRGRQVCDACGGNGRRLLAEPGNDPRPRPTGPPAPFPVLVPDRPLVFLGEAVSWSRPATGNGTPWTVFLAEAGARREIETLAGDSVRWTPREAGSYVAVSGGDRVFFDVVALLFKSSVSGAVAPGSPLTVSLESEPPLRDPRVSWEIAAPDGPRRAEGTSVTLTPAAWGRYRLTPVVELAGLPPRRAPEPFVLSASELKALPPGPGPFPASLPVAFSAASNPVLPEKSVYEWTVTGPAVTRTLTTKTPSADLRFEGAGRHSVQVRSGASVSAAIEVPVYSVAFEGADGKSVAEVRPALLAGAFDAEGRLRDGAVESAAERFRIVVDDPWPGAGGTVDLSALSGSLTCALEGAAPRRSTRPIVVLSDRSDAAAPAAGPGDPTFFASPRERLELRYRGATAAVAAVGPTILYEIPVRFVVVRSPGFAVPSREELERAFDLRLAQANRVWEPFGRRFGRAGIEVTDAPEHLALLRGRAAGVDANGRSSRAGVLLEGEELSVPLAWTEGSGPTTPLVTAEALARASGAGRAVDAFAGLLQGDREAVVLRFRRADDAPLRVTRLRRNEDVSQGLSPLPVVLGDGCEVASERGLFSLEEIGVLLGGRRPRGEAIDLFVVSRLRAGGAERTHKVYPEGLVPEALAGSALVAWRYLDGSGAWPYLLARVLGDVLLPADAVPGPEDTLFRHPPSLQEGVEANKRVGAATGVRILERGRWLSGGK
jgi:hypothetical protein